MFLWAKTEQYFLWPDFFRETHTMEDVMGDANQQGIIPRVVHDIFKHTNAMEKCRIFFRVFKGLNS